MVVWEILMLLLSSDTWSIAVLDISGAVRQNAVYLALPGSYTVSSALSVCSKSVNGRHRVINAAEIYLHCPRDCKAPQNI